MYVLRMHTYIHTTRSDVYVLLTYIYIYICSAGAVIDIPTYICTGDDINGVLKAYY